jgi:hypothetical protein
MRHGIAVNGLYRPPGFRQDHRMGGYKAIDPILLAWAEARGLHVYSGHKQNDVRSMTIYLWIGARHESSGHIWLDPPNELGLVGMHAAAGSFRFDDAVQPEKLSSALDALYERLAENKRRVDAF